MENLIIKLSPADVKKMIEESEDYTYDESKIINSTDQETGIEETYLVVKCYDRATELPLYFTFDNSGICNIVKNNKNIEHTQARLLAKSEIARDINRHFYSYMIEKFDDKFYTQQKNHLTDLLDSFKTIQSKFIKDKSKTLRKLTNSKSQAKISNQVDKLKEINENIDKYAIYTDTYERELKSLNEIKYGRERN